MRIDGYEFLARAYGYEGVPYVWGAKGPRQFDCSGLITRVIHECGGPNWMVTHNSARLFEALTPWLPELEKGFPRGIPRDVALALHIPAGLVACYGVGGISHVMVTTGDGRVFGSCGGDSRTTAPIPGAKVQFRPSLVYRPDLRGLRHLPEVSQ